MLNYTDFGEVSQHPNLLIVHGLFGSGRNWRAIAKHLSRDRRVITVDMRNHGDSFRSESQTYIDMADDIGTVVKYFGAPMDILGHSMGGKATMTLAMRAPELINRMIIADIAPVAYSHSSEQAKYIAAMQRVPLRTISRRADADEILKTDIPDVAVRAFFLQSLVIDLTGHYWKLNLDALNQNMDYIVGFPALSDPTATNGMFIRGGASDYILDEYAPIMKQLFPNTAIRTIDGAGHWVHAEAQRAFVAMVSDYIST